MDVQSDIPTNYRLSRRFAEYMRQRFRFLVFPGPNSPQPVPSLDMPVNHTVAMHQMVAILAQAYQHQSEFLPSSCTFQVKVYHSSPLWN